jgi:hypothetical protein
MTITDKLNRRVERAERYRQEAFGCAWLGVPDAALRVMSRRYVRAAVLVDLTAQKAIAERGR